MMKKNKELPCDNCRQKLAILETQIHCQSFGVIEIEVFKKHNYCAGQKPKNKIEE